ncbi:MAG: nucleotide exchange factor GrpE [Candidatus Omnitrophica bacterium]|nr:nucleotide exchange factor GrpE [Candidatus Omnitrophota bacterium]
MTAKDKKDDKNKDKNQDSETGAQGPAVRADIKDIEAELKVLREELLKKDAFQDRLLRLQAEFDNFRKRSAREKQEFIKYANEALIIELVGMLDNFERSIKAADQKQDFKLLHQGVDMISKQLHKLLEEKGLRRINSLGEKFDPVRHDAIEVVESADADDGAVLEEFQPGYMLNDKIIRPAMVKVAKNNKQQAACTQAESGKEPQSGDEESNKKGGKENMEETEKGPNTQD